MIGQSYFAPNQLEGYTPGVNVSSSCVEFSISQDTSGGTNAVTGENSGLDFEGLVAQTVQASCGRQPQIVYEIGTNKYYAIDSKPSGNGSLQNILGPSTKSMNSLQELGNICHPSEILIRIKPCSCNVDEQTRLANYTTDDQYFAFTGGFLTGVSITAQAQSYVVQGTWQFSFQDLQAY